MLNLEESGWLDYNKVSQNTRRGACYGGKGPSLFRDGWRALGGAGAYYLRDRVETLLQKKFTPVVSVVS